MEFLQYLHIEGFNVPVNIDDLRIPWKYLARAVGSYDPPVNLEKGRVNIDDHLLPPAPRQRLRRNSSTSKQLRIQYFDHILPHTKI